MSNVRARTLDDRRRIQPIARASDPGGSEDGARLLVGAEKEHSA
eukprot:CAMPEP_0170189400 /NCGR_PEP_ID=MMETSP0040_2-20121228/46741_1 /TAXON_ID=641309 /ORGANISM="Lotharella oceanica, Strain CCMP622" /LENGTH=43 /DNA_ID= /DNA_START= /DNA_END= /DNA_ORIENTATION=